MSMEWDSFFDIFIEEKKIKMQKPQLEFFFVQMPLKIAQVEGCD